MSKTFYGYVKRDLTKDPDWAAVTSKITDDLVDISKERQATRDDIQKKTLATQDILNTYDQGANQTFNSAIQKYRQRPARHQHRQLPFQFFS